MTITVNADDGVLLPLEDLDQVFSYNVAGTLAYIQVVYRGTTYRQSMTYVGGQCTAVTRWTAQ